ncbi:MAG: RNA-splicing ligase RtcB [Candidatus Cloacimonetes bacterium 4572_55]|nr:MAG: RNA-splicing ligase RtcB [Candidatus Cloacimonetes bacterium 4572_55]
MAYKVIDGIPVWGDPILEAVKQIKNCQKDADRCALMADHHQGYAVPIGGVTSYEGKISPSGVGYDISCGNKAVRLDIPVAEARKHIKRIMSDIFHTISFGIGMKNSEQVHHPLFDDDPAWQIKAAAELRQLARSQLGTVGSGNHFVDVFVDQNDQVWIGVHFGSRGFGHKLATHFIRAAGGKNGIFVDPVLLDVESSLGKEYIACMELAGRYAYAGRDWVCNRVAKFLGAKILEAVHNHHNYAWKETHFGKDVWVTRKGATPAFPGQRGFIGGSMGDISVIAEGVDSPESREALYSTIHGAGRTMSRTKAAGKRRWGKKKKKSGSKGEVSQEMMMEWVNRVGVELRGAGRDESPHCYKRLPKVLHYHKDMIKIIYTLNPIGVAMAGPDIFDPFRD